VINEEGKGELAATDMEKAEVLSEFFAASLLAVRFPLRLLSLNLKGDWGSGEQYPSHCESAARPRLPHETEYIQVYGDGRLASQGSEGAD